MATFNSALFNAALFGGGAGAAPGPIIQVGQGLLYPALRKAGVTIGPGRTPSVAQFQDAIDELNRLLGSLSCDPLWIYGQDILSLPLNGQTVYTIGIDPTGTLPAADFAVTVPKAITEAVYVSNGSHYGVRLLTPQLWAQQCHAGVYFDRGYPIANLYLNGQPSTGNLDLYIWHVIPSVANLADVIVIPSGYEDAIVLNLACRLAPQFQRRVDADLRQQARESLMRLESINAPMPIASLDNWGSCGCDDGGSIVISPGTGGGSGSGSGTVGPQGPPGPQGIQGPAGADGATGPQGETGPAGSAGGVNTVAFSATPTFDLALGALQKITLTGDVSSVNLSNPTAGAVYTLLVLQDAVGGRLFASAAAIRGAMVVGADPSAASVQQIVYDGSAYYAVSNGAINL